MNEILNSLSNKVHSPRYGGQLPEIRRLFDMYLRDVEIKKYESSPPVVYVSVGFIWAGIVLFAFWLLG